MTKLSAENWQVDSSETYQYNNQYLTTNAINGDLNNFWHSIFSNFPWLQVELAEEYIIGRVDVSTRIDDTNGELVRFNFLEVRVGDMDATGSSEDAKMCINQLCHRTGDDLGLVKPMKCVSPLKGKFVTIQKYDHSPEWPPYTEDPYQHKNLRYLEIANVDVYTFYCSATDHPCPHTNVDNCAMHQDGCKLP